MLCKLLFFFSFAAIGLVAGRTVVSSRQQRFQEWIRKECKRYVAEDKTPELIKVAEMLSKCILPNIEVQDFKALQQASSAEASEVVLRIARQLCRKKSEVEVCMFNMIDDSLRCTDPVSRDNPDVQKSALQNLYNNICYSNGHIVESLIQTGAIHCFESKAIQLRVCLTNAETVDLETLSTAQTCQINTELRNCIVGTLQQCSRRITAHIVSDVLKTVVKGSRCDNSTYNH